MKLKSTIASILIAVSFAGCSGSNWQVFSGYAQGGTYSVKADIRGASAGPGEIRSAIDSILTVVDTTLSGYNKGSQLSRFNAGEEVEVSSMFRDILGMSEQWLDRTEGALDVWSAPLFDIWGFGFRNGSFPDSAAVAATMEKCREHRTLNFNAIAQGYTCDLIAGYLHSIGVKDMLVDIGEIYCEGVNPSGTGWSIGIDTPEDGNETPGASLSGIWKSDGGSHGVVTSGNYRKFYIRDGKKYAHTIDPRTGYPVEHNLLSATVVAPTAAEADALATWFMVIGFDEAREKVQADPDIEACLITSEGIWKSEGF